MAYIITSRDKEFYSKGSSAQDILARAGDVMKTGTAPDNATRSEAFATTGDAGSSGMRKKALDYGAMTGGVSASQTYYTSPSFYSPIHTPLNWQIPTKRREVYMWNRFFAGNDPTIKSSLRFYSQFPFHGYDHVIDDPIRREHFDNLKKRLRLDHVLPLVAYEYFSMGDAFPFISIFCERCGGEGSFPDGSICDHKGGQITNVTVMNPDWIDVQINPLMPADPVISLQPDDSLKQIVWSKKPPEIFEKIPPKIRALIMQQKPIQLSSRSISHLKHDEIPYMAYGSSIITPLFPILAYQDRLRQAQWVVAERHILPIKVCKIGNDERPASGADILDTQRQLATTANDPNLTLVTHHAFDFEWVGAAGKVLQLTKEYELVDQALVKGLGVNEALLSGTGPSYSQAAIGIEATIKRLRTVQQMIAYWITEKIYKLEAQMRGFYKKNLQGEVVLDYPDIRWSDLNLRDETQKQQMYMQLWDKQIVSTQFICEQLDIDYNTETERVRMEQIFQQQMGIAPQGQEGGMGGGFGGGGGGGMGGGSLGGGKPKGIGGDQQGNLPGGQSGPGLPGDGIAPSMSGGAPGGAPPGPQAAYETQLTNYNAAQEHAPSISRKSRIQEPKPPRMQVEETPQAEMYTGPRTGAFRLTDIERLLYSEVNKAQRNGNIPLDFQWQINPVPHDPECSKIICDGVFPDIKLAVEADGKQWHAAPDDVVRDQDRDARLARHGWSILRFTEDQIKHYMQDVISTIIKTVEEMTVTSSDKGRKVFASGGYTYKEAEKSIDITDDIEIDPSLKMSEKEEFVVDQAFKQTAKNIGEDLDIEKLKKNAEVISEDLEEIDREDDLEMRDLVKQREELGNLIPEK